MAVTKQKSFLSILITLTGLLMIFAVPASPAESLDQAELTRAGDLVTLAISDGLSPVREYRVQEGETLWDVAEKLDVTVRQLIAANIVRIPDGIPTGTKLIVPTSEDFLNLALPGISESSLIEGGSYTVKAGDTIPSIASRFGIDADQLRLANKIQNNLIYVGQQLLLPEKDEFLIPAIGEMRWPFYRRNWDYTISQGYRPDHAGVDFVLPEGVPIRAVADGYVTFAGWDNIGYGNMVMVGHSDGFYTLYAHMETIEVERGQKVDRENILGYSGNTGNSSNPHLHFEIREGFIPLNPCIYLPGGC
ncbi:MAG: M23 family metallopeptidase [Chloroflexota bacterium]